LIPQRKKERALLRIAVTLRFLLNQLCIITSSLKFVEVLEAVGEGPEVVPLVTTIGAGLFVNAEVAGSAGEGYITSRTGLILHFQRYHHYSYYKN
jgi:hypothetical protein